jgi:uncharacterized protein involved in outer membrane biogenesis
MKYLHFKSIIFRLLLVLGIFTVLLCLALLNLRTSIQIVATQVLGRAVSIGETKVLFHPLTVEIHDVHIANASWGHEPDMVRIGHLTAVPDQDALFLGTVKFCKLSVENASLFLERDNNGKGNWKSDNASSSTSRSPEAEAARIREQFPTILDLTLINSQFRMRTSSGAMLKIDYKEVHLHTPDEQEPIILDATGAYNDIPVHINIQTQPYKKLHASRIPFQVDIAASAATATVISKLQMLDPLNFDQFNGTIHIETKNAGRAASIFSANFDWNIPASMESTFAREGDIWTFNDATGNVDGNAFYSSAIHLNEGSRKKPDNIRIILKFKKIALNTLMEPHQKEAKKTNMRTVVLLKNGNEPSVILDAVITSDKVSLPQLTILNFNLHAGITAENSVFGNITTNVADGKLQTSIKTIPGKENSTIEAKVTLSHIKMQQILELLRVKNAPLKGMITATLSLKAKGNTLQEWANSAWGNADAVMRDGNISRLFFRVISTDVRTILGKDSKDLSMPCVKAAIVFKNGQGILSPFWAETTKGNIRGDGTISLPRQSLDLVFQTDPQSTSALALNIPINIIGTFDKLHVGPSADSKTVIQLKSIPEATCKSE